MPSNLSHQVGSVAHDRGSRDRGPVTREAGTSKSVRKVEVYPQLFTLVLLLKTCFTPVQSDGTFLAQLVRLIIYNLEAFF